MRVNDLIRENNPLTEEVAKLREALRHLYMSAVDQHKGYADKDLHESPRETLQRAYLALRDTEDDPDTVPEPPK